MLKHGQWVVIQCRTNFVLERLTYNEEQNQCTSHPVLAAWRTIHLQAKRQKYRTVRYTLYKYETNSCTSQDSHDEIQCAATRTKIRLTFTALSQLDHMIIYMITCKLSLYAQNYLRPYSSALFIKFLMLILPLSHSPSPPTVKCKKLPVVAMAHQNDYSHIAAK